jgi:spore coat polysaccharide biosynthesis protein SpsF
MTVRKAVALIPCRLDSTRLPGKALLDVGGQPAICRLIGQVERSEYLQRQDIVVCTTLRATDDPLVEVIESIGASVFRGHTDDLVDRLFHATLAFPSELVLEIDGDDICADPTYMDQALAAVESGECDVAYSGAGLPLGAGTKAFSQSCLAKIHECYVPGKNDTGFGYYLTKSGLFRTLEVYCKKPDLALQNLRLTLDYPEDLELFRKIYAQADQRGQQVSVEFLSKLIGELPQLAQINANLDEGYWERTQALMDANPLQFRSAGEVRTIEEVR